jgi:hypothetical protein
MAPLLALYKKSDKGLVFWITLSIIIDIFNSQHFLNLTAVKVTSIVLLPITILKWKEYINDKTAKELFSYFLLLTLLGLIYGFIFPWQDTTGERSIKDLSQFRSILHLGSFFLEAHLALFLGYLLKSEQNFSFFKKSLLYSFSIMAIGPLIESLTQLDLYHFFTGGRALFDPTRLRGFNYEPRGLAQSAAYAIIFAPILNLKKLLIPFVLIMLALIFYFTMSATGILSLLVGISIALVLFILKNKLKSIIKPVIAFILVALVSMTSFYFIAPEETKSRFYYHFIDRIYVIKSNSLVNKLEVFDAASLNYLVQNKKHLAVGTGPGLVYLPASPYIIERDKRIWGDHFSALPHMGIILILANSGIVGVALWLMINLKWIRRRYSLYKKSNSIHDFEKMYIQVICLGLYLLQIRYFLIFGIALSAFIPTRTTKD